MVKYVSDATRSRIDADVVNTGEIIYVCFKNWIYYKAVVQETPGERFKYLNILELLSEAVQYFWTCIILALI